MHGEAVVLENDIREQWNLLEMTDEILSLQVTDDSQCRNGFLTEENWSFVRNDRK